MPKICTYSEEEKSVMWITKRLTESHVFSVLSTVYIFANYCFNNEPVENFEYNMTRFYVHIVATALALYGLGLEIYWFPPAKVEDERYTFLKNNVLGYFHFLTLWIQTICTLHYVFGLIAEFTIHFPQYFGTCWSVYKFCYGILPFVQSLAIMLAILFFKFCWFDEGWQNVVVVRLVERGYDNVRKVACFTHIAWVPLAFLDVFYLRKANTELIQPLNYQLLWSAFFGIFYMGIMYSFHTWCGLWPYPFLNDMGKTGRLIFFSVIVCIFIMFSGFSSYFIGWINK
jgi:hypothetical protein